MTRQDRLALAQRFFDCFSAGDLPGALATLSDDATWWIPGDPARLPTAGLYPKERIARLFQRMLAALDSKGLQMRLVASVCEGNQVALEVESAGDLLNGRRYRQQYHLRLQFRDGLICSVREYLDTLHAHDVWVAPVPAPTPPDAQQLLQFWFDEIQPAQWWRVDPAFDATLRQRFGALHPAAAVGELAAWRSTPAGRLAEVIVLDQWSRNLHRGTAQAFACDPMALALAQEAVAGGHDAALPPRQRAFLYMPYEHSESRAVHGQAEALFASLGLPDALDYELRHKAIVDRFGRYPHRNQVLGRVSTPEELKFLTEPGSSF
jgi:uncharacterized protein (DUF924 family)/ketosteroid isomerase-like protein